MELVLLILLLLAILLIVVNHYFTIGVVQGNSMKPTYHPWEIVLIKKKHFSPKVGNCYVFQREERPVIKRLLYIKSDFVTGKTYFWMEGDNSRESTDSKDYGYVSENALIGEVVKWRRR